METYGDLKKAIKVIGLKQKGAAIGNVAVDVVLNSIPGAGAAKTTFDFIKAAFNKPDTKKTNSWLDKLDVDDNMSAIVDDTVENGFLKMIAKTIESESDDKPLESDFNMNQRMVDYLKKNYGGRTVTGIKEMEDNKTIQRMKELAGIKPTNEATNVSSSEELVKALEKQLGSDGPTQYKINGSGRMADNTEAYLKDKLKGNNEPMLEPLADAISSFLTYNFDGMEVDTSMGDTIVRPKGSNEFHIQLSRTAMKEADLGVPEKETPAVKNIDRDLADRGSDFKLISTKDKLVELLDTIVNQLDPKFKESPAFRTGVREFFTKHK